MCNEYGWKKWIGCTKPHSEIKGDINIYPLPHLKVQKDLIGDLNTLYKQYHSVEPWLKNSNKNDSKENLQSIEDRSKLDGFINDNVKACCSTHVQAIGGMETNIWSSCITSSI